MRNNHISVSEHRTHICGTGYGQVAPKGLCFEYGGDHQMSELLSKLWAYSLSKNKITSSELTYERRDFVERRET